MAAPLHLVEESPALFDAPVRFGRLGTTPVLPLRLESLDEHLDRFGPAPAGRPALVEALEAAGVAGRGGAWFPAARKWRAVLDAPPGGVVVANGAEGEPAAVKDAALLQTRPHLVLDGLQIAAEAVGARDLIVWLHEGAAETQCAVERALAERLRAGNRTPVRVVTGPDRYLSGESSAVVRALSGGPALPAFRRGPSARSGVDGRPTLLHNVETLARIALVARYGAEVPDSRLLTLVTSGGRTVLEVDADTPLGAVLAGRASGIHAVLLGGYGGTWLPWHGVADRPLAALGRQLGAGIVAPLPADVCGLAETAAVARYLAGEHAGQCGPCMFGLPAIAERLTLLADRRRARRHVTAIERFGEEIAGRGTCHLPDGVVHLAGSALACFADDVAAHLRGRCLHGGGPAALLPIPQDEP